MFGSNRFNFGSRPFKFPPADTEFRSFNSEGSLSDEQRMILPRHMRLQLQVSSRKCGYSRVSFPHSPCYDIIYSDKKPWSPEKGVDCWRVLELLH